MGDASIVHISVGRLSTLPPSNALTGRQLVFHHWSRSDWRRTQCGRPYEIGEDTNPLSRRREMVAVRRDTAELIADPCSVCFAGESV